MISLTTPYRGVGVRVHAVEAVAQRGIFIQIVTVFSHSARVDFFYYFIMWHI